MSYLVDLIDTYKDTHGQPSDASIARAIDVTRQTISTWRKDGIRELPKRSTLHAMADFMGLPRRVVIEAALVDAKYMPASEMRRPPEPTLPAPDVAEGRSA